MRMLIVTSFFPPLNSIASHRPYSWAKYWSQAGHDVTVLTPEKIRDLKTDLDVSLDGFTCIETAPLPLVRYLKGKFRQAAASTPHAPPSTSSSASLLKSTLGFIRRRLGILDSCHMPDITDLWVNQAFAAIRHSQPWDIVVSTVPPFPIHRLAYRIKKEGLAKKWIMDFRDLIVGNPVTGGLFPFSAIERWLERRYIAAADAVTTVSEGLARSLKTRYPGANVHVVANGYEPADIMQLPSCCYFDDPNKFRLVYLGTVYEGKQNPVPLFKAISELSQSKTHAALLDLLEVKFYGPRLDHLTKLIARYDVSKWVKVEGFVKRSEAIQIQRDAHALLFLPWTDPNAAGILSGKIFEYLSSGTEIVALGSSHMESAQELLAEAQAGELLFDKVHDIKSYLMKRLQTPLQRPSARPNAQLLEQYTRQTLANQMLKIMSTS